VTLTMPLLGVVCHPKSRTWYSLPLHNIDDYSFRRSKDIIGAQKFKMVHVTWPHPFQGCCHSLARTSYYQSDYQIWSPYLRPLQRYDWKGIQNVENSI